MSKENKVSVVIANYNGNKYLKKCLESLVLHKWNYEVVVIDDGSSPRLIFAEAKLGRVKMIRLPRNMGAAMARNIGVANSTGEYILFLDVDSIVKGDAVRTLTKRLDSDKNIGAVQAKMDTCGHFLSWWGLPYEIAEPTNPIFAGRTAGLMIKRKVFEEINGFDDDYIIYGEDTDLCWRTWLLGYRVELEEKAVIDHVGKSSQNKKTKIRVVGLGARNCILNILKNADWAVIWWMLPLHFLAWIMIFVKLLIVGRAKEAGAVAWGWGWNVININKTIRKRELVIRFKGNKTRQVMFGNMKLGQLLRKGLRWWREV